MNPASFRRSVPVLLVALIVLAGCGSGGSEPDASADAADAPGGGFETLRGGDPLPEATLPVLGGEGQLALHEIDGPVVLNFWATWCAFCVDEMPDIEEAHRLLDGRVTFVGIDREDDPEAAHELAQETGVTYALVEDVDGSYFRALQARGMPTTVFIDAEGIVQHRFAGPLETDQLLELVEEHLGVTET